jgi:metal-responsive CopG/Arc/MetJ family transcriptional regulator
MIVQNKAVEMAVGTKLNYVIPELLDDALNTYCEQTGRSASDVIRQLLAEYIDGDRKLSVPPRETLGGIRSNMMLPPRILEALDRKLTSEGITSRGGTITRLLYDFLENRVGGSVLEPITINIDRTTYKKLSERGQKLGKTIEEIITEACRIYTKMEIKNDQ